METNELVSLTLCFQVEQIAGKGEDTSLRQTDGVKASFIACMDGCGGAGAQVYAKANNQSGARIAAEHTALALRNWFINNCYSANGFSGKSASDIASEMKSEIDRELLRQKELVGDEESGVKSRLAKTFPTTLASIVIDKSAEKNVRCISFWAGDSRTYILRTTGLQQTSIDDIRGHWDPFEALKNDGRLINVISLSSEYEIHYQEDYLNEPFIIVTATDGCFSYFRSPMEFEWILLETLANSKTPADWESCLCELLGEFASDDYSMNICTVGYQDWREIQKAYNNRYVEFKQQFGEPLLQILSDNDEQAHYTLWQKYKAGYMPENRGIDSCQVQ